MKTHYLDNSATTQVLPEAAQAALDSMTESFGNPSSLHTLGFEAKARLDSARAAVARRLGAREEEIVFTSGGTEANNLALLGGALAKRRVGKKIVTSAIEHDSVRNAGKELEQMGFQVEVLPPDSTGKIPEEALFAAIDRDTVLVSLQLVNNETGAIQPVAAAARAIQRAGGQALLHTDCVQAFCKMEFTPQRLGADLCTVSGHKVHGPKGVGALWVKKGVRILPRTLGGGQERGLRSGTEAAPLIEAFGKAVELAPRPRAVLPEVEALRDALRRGLEEIPEAVVNSPEDALPYVQNFSVLGVRAETMLHFLAQRGVYVSAGSACGRAKPSHVLTAMGLEKSRVESALRVSFSRFSTQEDVDALLEGIREGLKSLQRTARRGTE